MAFIDSPLGGNRPDLVQQHERLKFEDLTVDQYGGVDVPYHYQDLVWTDFGVLDPRIAYPDVPDSGYFTGVVSGHQVAYGKVYDDNPDSESAIRVDGRSHGTFTLNSVDMTAAWDSSLKVTVLGVVYVKEVAKIVYSIPVTISDTGPTHAVLNIKDVNAIFFAHSDGVHDPRLGGFGGDNIAFDNFVFSHIVDSEASPPPAFLPPPAFAASALTHSPVDAVQAPHLDLHHIAAIA